MSMTSMNISLPEELKDYVEQQTRAGYSTPSEFVRQLIREDQKRRNRERLEQLLLEGLDSGQPIPADKKFWSDLKRQAAELMETRRKGLKARRK
jgi:antitoxin ParD1/3/4